MGKSLNIRKRAVRLKRGARYVLVSPSGGAMHVSLFGVINNGGARYFVLRYDGRGITK